MVYAKAYLIQVYQKLTLRSTAAIRKVSATLTFH